MYPGDSSSAVGLYLAEAEPAVRQVVGLHGRLVGASFFTTRGDFYGGSGVL